MRILHTYKDYFPVLGGIENHVKVLAEAQAAAGHQVIVSVCSLGRQTHVTEQAGVKIIRSGRLATAASMPISVSQPLVIWRLKPDIVHIHSPYPLGEISTRLFKRGTPYVITYHSDIVRQRGWLKLYGPLLRRILARADRIMPTSPAYLATSPWLELVKDRCTVVPLGVDHRRFTPPAQAFNGAPTVLFVGRLRYYKGLDTMLRALKQLPEVQFVIAGSGPMQAEWEALTSQLGLNERVKYLGEISDDELPQLYHRAHLFVLPANARSEAFGTVLLEAMAAGLPCITTEIGTGTSWVVQDGVTGRVVPAGDEYGLANAIRNLIDHPAVREEMGHAARARIEAEFTQDLMTQRVLEVYRQVLEHT